MVENHGGIEGIGVVEEGATVREGSVGAEWEERREESGKTRPVVGTEGEGHSWVNGDPRVTEA